MIQVSRIELSEMDELARRSWEVGIIYFQVFEQSPNPAFYAAITNMLPYEQIVEISGANIQNLRMQLSFKGAVPFFGAVTAGWFLSVTDDPADSAKIVAFARRSVVLPPGTKSTKRRSASENITLEGI